MISLLLFILLCFAAAAIGSVFTAGSVKTWYVTLKKPSWNPPASVFAPVWTVLYVMMAVAAWTAWEHRPHQGASLPMAFFLAQLALNVLWSALFFGWHRPGWAFVELMILWLFILLTVISFWGISWLAGALLIPYLLWVSFASVLNFTIWRLNRAGSFLDRDP